MKTLSRVAKPTVNNASENYQVCMWQWQLVIFNNRCLNNKNKAKKVNWDYVLYLYD